jgi:hypothetical protein
MSFSSLAGPAEKVEFYGHPIVYIATSVYGHPHVSVFRLLSLLTRLNNCTDCLVILVV